jgi:hypothetical protein
LLKSLPTRPLNTGKYTLDGRSRRQAVAFKPQKFAISVTNNCTPQKFHRTVNEF